MAELAPPPAWFRLGRAVLRRLPAGRFRLFDLLARGIRGPFLDRMGDQAGRSRYRCDLKHLIAREICLTGRYAPMETALVRACLVPGDTFVDVGANLGYFALLGAACVGPAGRVLAVEPDPRMAAALRENLALNRAGQVRVVEAAAGEREGSALLAGYADRSGNWGASTLLRDRPGDGPSFPVRCASLDRLLDEAAIDRVALVKVDVEGAESQVLRGMAEGLRRGRYRRVLVEMHPWEHTDFRSELIEMDARMRAEGLEGFLLPEATRPAYYGAAPAGTPRPLVATAPVGARPHVLWALPGSGPA